VKRPTSRYDTDAPIYYKLVVAHLYLTKRINVMSCSFARW